MITVKKISSAWTLFLPGGIRLQGAHEYTPPAINITTVDIKTGAMDAPVAVDDGMEALTCSFKIYGYDVAMLTLLGLQAGIYSRRLLSVRRIRWGSQPVVRLKHCRG